jgi:broad specificity phosphatase PhoE
MTTIVFLVRHGQTKSNVTGFYMGRSEEELTEVGYEQVQRLSSRLSGLPIASVYTSPLRRAYATAMIIAEPHGVELKVVNNLIEMNLGDWQGLYTNEISRTWPKLWKRWRVDPSEVTIPNGESLYDVAERAISAFNTVVESNQGNQAIIVAHEVIVKLIVAYVISAPNSIYRRFEINNASLTVIQCRDNDSRLIGLNDVSHLRSRL